MKICGKIWKMLIYNICICMHFFFQLFWNSQTLPELKLRLKYSKLYFSTSWHLKWKWMVRPCWMYLYMLTSKNHTLIFIENHTSIPEAWTLPHWSPNHPMGFVLLWKPWIYLPSIAFTNRLSSRSVLYLFIACQICVSNRWNLNLSSSDMQQLYLTNENVVSVSSFACPGSAAAALM